MKKISIVILGLLASCASQVEEPLFEVLHPTLEKDRLTSELARVWNILEQRTEPYTQSQWKDWLKTMAPRWPFKNQNQVLFLVNGSPEWRGVYLAGSLMGEDEAAPLKKIGTSGVWGVALEVTVPDFTYVFLAKTGEDLTRFPDPENPFLVGGRNFQSRFWQEPSQHGRLVWIDEAEAPQATAPLSPRGLYIYLPPGYDPSGTTRYPITYWADGQNLWDNPEIMGGGWKIDTVSDRLIVSGQIPPQIHVGLPNSSHREEEYVGLGFRDKETGELWEKKRAYYDAHSRWILQSVKPWVDRRFPTRPTPDHTALVGSSYGGSLALTLSLLNPQTFGRAAGLSVAGAYPPEGYRPYDPKHVLGPFPVVLEMLKENPPVKVWVDAGSEEPGNAWGAEYMRDQLIKLGYQKNQDLGFEIFPGAGHNEGAWSERIGQILTWLWK